MNRAEVGKQNYSEHFVTRWTTFAGIRHNKDT